MDWAKRQLQDETRNILVLGLGAPYIRELTVDKKPSPDPCNLSVVRRYMASSGHNELIIIEIFLVCRNSHYIYHRNDNIKKCHSFELFFW